MFASFIIQKNGEINEELQVKKLKIMSLNMVANQSSSKGTVSRASLADLKKSLTQLELSESGKKATNPTEWDSKLRQLFASYGLTAFLQMTCSIQVASENVPEIVVEQQVQALLDEWKKQNAQGVKTEAADEARLMSFMRERAKEMHGDMVQESADNELRQIREVTFFLEWLTAVPTEHKGLNPRAQHEGSHKGKKYWMELESPKKREERQTAWELLIHSLSGPNGFPKSSWDHVPIGNVYQLYKLVLAQFKSDDRTAVVKELKRRMETFLKKKNETFGAFWGRFQKMRLEMKEIKMNVDPDVMMVIFTEAISQSEDKQAKEALRTLMMVCSAEQRVTVDQIFEKMEDTMKEREKEVNKKDDEEFEKKKKKKDKRARQRERKAREDAESSDSSSSEDEKEHQAVARKATANKSESEDVRGVCFWHQEGKCNRGKECTFEHRKLSKEGKGKLQKIMAERNEKKTGGDKKPITCYSCGEKGHISPKCPNLKKSVANKTYVETVSSDSDSMMSKATAGMTDEQLKMFAQHMFDLNEAAKNKH